MLNWLSKNSTQTFRTGQHSMNPHQLVPWATRLGLLHQVIRAPQTIWFVARICYCPMLKLWKSSGEATTPVKLELSWITNGPTQTIHQTWTTCSWLNGTGTMCLAFGQIPSLVQAISQRV